MSHNIRFNWPNLHDYIGFYHNDIRINQMIPHVGINPFAYLEYLHYGIFLHNQVI